MFAIFLNLYVLPILTYILYITSTTIVITIIAYRLLLWQRFKYWNYKNINQIPPSFPSGNFHDVLVQKKSIGGFIQELYEYSQDKLSGFYIMHYPHILIRSPDLVKRVLVSDFGFFSDRTIASDDRADPISAKLLLNVKNPEWKIMRQKVTPVFTTSKLRTMSEHIVKSCRDLMKYIDENLKKGPIETKELFSKFATDVIISCAFGMEANCFVDNDAPFRQAGREMMEPTFMNGLRQMSYFLLPQAVKLFRIPFFDRHTMQFLKDTFLQTIEYRETKATGPRGDLIDIIIELKKNKDLGGGIVFEGDRVVAQSIQFYAAGFETISATLSYLLYELALNSDIQEEARQAIVDFVNNGGILNYDNMSQMSYLDRVILETIRKYPPLPFLDRRCNKDFYISDLNVTIPKDTPVYISIIGMHYNEEYFPDPHRFNPDRFLPENVKNRQPFVYIPFGLGPHICIGERFAMNVIKISVAHFLLKYKVEPCAETEIPLQFATKGFGLTANKGVTLKIAQLQNSLSMT